MRRVLASANVAGATSPGGLIPHATSLLTGLTMRRVSRDRREEEGREVREVREEKGREGREEKRR